MLCFASFTRDTEASREVVRLLANEGPLLSVRAVFVSVCHVTRTHTQTYAHFPILTNPGGGDRPLGRFLHQQANLAEESDSLPLSNHYSACLVGIEVL